MEKNITLLQNQKEQLEKYVKFIEEECKDFIITYLLDKKRNATLDDVEKYKDFFESLDKTCDSDVFKKLCALIYQVPKTCSFLTEISGDGGSTTYEYNSNTKEIKGCVSMDLPPFNRATMDFIYLHEGVHGLFWDSRKGKTFIDSPDVEVLPYFFMLYALEHLHDNYEEDTVNSILGRFIANTYSCGRNILDNIDNRFIQYSEQELNQKFHLERYELENIKEKKKDLYSDYQQFLGPIKSVILYNYCISEKIPFELVLNSVLDSEKLIGTELNYSLLDISNDENFDIYKSFVKTKKMVLPPKHQ